MRINAYLFQHSTDALEPLRQLGPLSAELSLMMLDRTAAREPAFTEPVGARDDVAVPLTPELQQLTRGLHPLAPLGGPGSGLVGVGAHLRRLHGLGLGAHRDLAATLRACGLGAGDVSQVVHGLREGGVLVLGEAEQLRPELRRHSQELALELPDDGPEAPPAVLAPQAPVTGAAVYEPALAPARDETANREER